MSDCLFSVYLGGQDAILKMGPVVVPSMKVTPSNFGTIQVAGGVPGPPGTPGASTASLINDHIIDTTPHPAYDDLPSLTLLFENGLV